MVPSAEPSMRRVWSARKPLEANTNKRADSGERSITEVTTPRPSSSLASSASSAASTASASPSASSASSSSSGEGLPAKSESKRPLNRTPTRRLCWSPSGVKALRPCSLIRGSTSVEVDSQLPGEVRSSSTTSRSAFLSASSSMGDAQAMVTCGSPEVMIESGLRLGARMSGK